MTELLRLEKVSFGYGGVPVISDLSLHVDADEVVVLLGPNGAGKTTLARGLMGRIRGGRGSLTFAGMRILGLPTHELMRRGMVLVPEGRLLIGDLTAEDNLRLGAIARTWQGASEADLEMVYELFPRVRERAKVRAGSLSGGEQQMVAIGRALVMRPRLLVLDEPSLGLAPLLVQTLFEAVAKLRERGTAVLLIEQNARAALAIATRVYVMRSGRIVHDGPPAEINASRDLARLYFG